MNLSRTSVSGLDRSFGGSIRKVHLHGTYPSRRRPHCPVGARKASRPVSTHEVAQPPKGSLSYEAALEVWQG